MTRLDADTYDLVYASLTEAEGLVLVVYDDATGKPLKSGDKIKGHPTIGYGRNLAGRGITRAEAGALLYNDIQEAHKSATQWLTHEGFLNLTSVRQSVVVEMAFQLGYPKLSKFVTTRDHILAGRYEDASNSMLKSLWASQVPKRAARLALRMRTNTREPVS